MKNNKGFLLVSETLKIIIAVICIGFLIYFLTSLYFGNLNKEKTIQAEATSNRILDVIKNAKPEGEFVSALTPIGWNLFSFVENDKKPNSCAGESCLCICKKILITPNLFDRQIKKCDKDGVCFIVLQLKRFDEIKITKLEKGSTDIIIKKVNDMIEVSKKE